MRPGEAQSHAVKSFCPGQDLGGSAAPAHSTRDPGNKRFVMLSSGRSSLRSRPPPGPEALLGAGYGHRKLHNGCSSNDRLMACLEDLIGLLLLGRPFCTARSLSGSRRIDPGCLFGRILSDVTPRGITRCGSDGEALLDGLAQEWLGLWCLRFAS